jgi:hypothetical protein
MRRGPNGPSQAARDHLHKFRGRAEEVIQFSISTGQDPETTKRLRDVAKETETK